jgi:hypothetical protein
MADEIQRLPSIPEDERSTPLDYQREGWRYERQSLLWIPSDWEFFSDQSVFDWDHSTLVKVAARNARLRFGRSKRMRDFMEDAWAKHDLARASLAARRLEQQGEGQAATQLRSLALEAARKYPAAAARIYADFSLYMYAYAAFLLLTVLSLPAFIDWWMSSDRPWWELLLMAILNLLLVTLALIFGLLISSFNKRILQTYRLAIYFIAVTFVAMGAAIGLASRHIDRGILVQIWVSASLGIVISVLVLSTILWFFRQRLLRAQVQLDPQTEVVIVLSASVTNGVLWEESEIATQQLIDAIERQASRCEQHLTLFGKFSESIVFRKSSRSLGSQLAAVLRKHQDYAIQLQDPDRGLLTTSLTSGMAHILRSDWPSFLVVQEQPEPPRVSILRRYGGRVVLALGLVLVAVFLPQWYPDLIGEAQPFRLTLLVTAVAALFSPDVQKAADAVTSVTRS